MALGKADEIVIVDAERGGVAQDEMPFAGQSRGNVSGPFCPVLTVDRAGAVEQRTARPGLLVYKDDRTASGGGVGSGRESGRSGPDDEDVAMMIDLVGR
jgi:hypothetical protein